MSNLPKPTPEEPQEPELSLQGLSEAFAAALARDVRPRPDSATPLEDSTNLSQEADAEGFLAGTEGAEVFAAAPPEAESDADADDACPICPRTILEAMLFIGNSGNQPLVSDQAASLMRGVEPEEVPELVKQLNESYRQGGCPYEIVSEGAGFRLTLGERYHWVRDKFYGRIREARLSQAAIDVLAIVAYRQPIGADEVSQLRDKPSYHILTQLVRRQLLRVERPSGKPRKTLYHTTDRFLELFELESLADLPESTEIDWS